MSVSSPENGSISIRIAIPSTVYPDITDDLTFNISAIHSDARHLNPIKIILGEKFRSKVNGPIEKVNDALLEVAQDRFNIKRTGVCFAQSEEDEKYKIAVQQIYRKFRFPLTCGKDNISCSLTVGWRKPNR